jgi:pimeloyl-ACP methyl ester carboxylesterase
MAACRAPVKLAFKRIAGAGTPSARPAVLMHGLLGNAANLNSLGKSLSIHRDVILVDLANHGTSPWVLAAGSTDGGMAYPDMAGDIAHLLDSLSIDEACLVGHSMGGKVAMATALMHPSRVSALTVLDIAPLDYSKSSSADDSNDEDGGNNNNNNSGPSESSVYLRALRSMDLDGVKSRKDADQMLKDAVPSSNAMMRGFLLQNMAAAAVGANDTSSPGEKKNAFQWRSNLEGIEASMPDISRFPFALPNDDAHGAGTVQVEPFGRPTLFLGGADSDFMTSQAASMRIESAFGGVVELLDGCGHYLHVQQPKVVAGRISAFLESALP